MKRKLILVIMCLMAINCCLGQSISYPLNTNEFSDLNFKRNKLNSEIPQLEGKASELKSLSDTLALMLQIRLVNSGIKYYRDQLDKKDIPADIALGNKTNYDKLNDSLSYFNNKLQLAKNDNSVLSKIRTSIQIKKDSLISIENAINQLMIPKLNQQNFLFWSAFAFVILMCIILGTFFFVVRKDAQVRAIIFGSDSGIQFIALFSIIIAIILFGLAGILEGKELSALLGSIAGYILGKVKFSNAPQNVKTESDTPVDTTTEPK